MRNVVAQYDLDRVDGRLQAVRAAAPLLSSIRDGSLVRGYLRDLAQLVGMDVEEVRQIVSSRYAGRCRQPTNHPSSGHLRAGARRAGAGRIVAAVAGPRDRNLAVERDTLKLMLQYPTLFDTTWSQVVQMISPTPPTARSSR